jgi:1-deoxy-D-xylulose-5-phosphate reductoisomerase
VAADEVAVGAFLAGRIRFGDIAEVIGETLSAVGAQPSGDLASIFAAEREARAAASVITNDIAHRAGGHTGAAGGQSASGV